MEWNGAGSILRFLDESKIFSIEKNGDEFIITEECDGYYSEHLTKGDMLKLADEIRELANG